MTWGVNRFQKSIEKIKRGNVPSKPFANVIGYRDLLIQFISDFVRLFGGWYAACTLEQEELEGINEFKCALFKKGDIVNESSKILMRIKRILVFYETVLVVMMIHDTKELMDRYLIKMRKSAQK